MHKSGGVVTCQSTSAASRSAGEGRRTSSAKALGAELSILSDSERLIPVPDLQGKANVIYYGVLLNLESMLLMKNEVKTCSGFLGSPPSIRQHVPASRNLSSSAQSEHHY